MLAVRPMSVSCYFFKFPSLSLSFRITIIMPSALLDPTTIKAVVDFVNSTVNEEGQVRKDLKFNHRPLEINTVKDWEVKKVGQEKREDCKCRK